jgi:hypothetical protein
MIVVAAIWLVLDAAQTPSSRVWFSRITGAAHVGAQVFEDLWDGVWPPLGREEAIGAEPHRFEHGVVLRTPALVLVLVLGHPHVPSVQGMSSFGEQGHLPCLGASVRARASVGCALSAVVG